MEMKQTTLMVGGNEPERLYAIVKVLESKQIKVKAQVLSYDGYGTFWGFVRVTLSETDQVMQELLEAGFTVVRRDRNEATDLVSNHAAAMANCA